MLRLVGKACGPFVIALARRGLCPIGLRRAKEPFRAAKDTTFEYVWPE